VAFQEIEHSTAGARVHARVANTTAVHTRAASEGTKSSWLPRSKLSVAGKVVQAATARASVPSTAPAFWLMCVWKMLEAFSDVVSERFRAMTLPPGKPGGSKLGRAGSERERSDKAGADLVTIRGSCERCCFG
jgi:hypothetical protein